MPPKLNTSDITNIDKQIESLLECKPLSEQDVKALCEKVPQKKDNSSKSIFFLRLKRSWVRKAMCKA